MSPVNIWRGNIFNAMKKNTMLCTPLIRFPQYLASLQTIHDTHISYRKAQVLLGSHFIRLAYIKILYTPLLYTCVHSVLGTVHIRPTLLGPHY